MDQSVKSEVTILLYKITFPPLYWLPNENYIVKDFEEETDYFQFLAQIQLVNREILFQVFLNFIAFIFN